MGVREENLNVMLAELLAERGLRALGEVVLRQGRRRPEPDVLIELNGIRIVIEGRKPGTWSELTRLCEQRLDDGICDLCVMVEYVDVKPEGLVPTQLDIKNALLKGKFNIGFVSYIDRVGLGRWLGITPSPERYENIGFDELLTYIMNAYSKVIQEDAIEPVIERINQVLGDFAKEVSLIIGDVERLKQVLELREKEVEPDEH
jgi:hypothetical protein